jgi:hypothetical protein
MDNNFQVGTKPESIWINTFTDQNFSVLKYQLTNVYFTSLTPWRATFTLFNKRASKPYS